MKKLFTLLLLGLLSFNVAAETPESIEHFLQSQKTIRVAMDNTPGFGNQATSMSIMALFRELGFKGTFEVIYRNQTADRIKILFGLPLALPDDYFDAKSNTHFIKLKEFLKRKKSNTLPQLPFAFTGAGDRFPCELEFTADGFKMVGDVEDSTDQVSVYCYQNRANLLNVKTFLRIPAFYYAPSSDEYFNDNDPEGKPSNELKNTTEKYFPTPPASLNDVNYFLHQDAEGKKILREKPALNAYIEGLLQKKFNVMPVYGFTIKGIDNIFQILTSARYAQLNGPANFKKPLIVTVFYDYHEEAARILHLLHADHWDKDENKAAVIMRNAIHELGMIGKVEAISIADPGASERIQNLQPDHILILWLGPLPKYVFDGLYGYSNENVLPTIYEGPNSFNTLVLNGKVLFRCPRGIDADPITSKYNLDFMHGSDEAGLEKLKALYGDSLFCHGTSTWEKNPEIYKLMGNMIIDAGDPNSDLAKHYQMLKEEASNPDNHRVNAALKAMLQETANR
ncbi:MAG: hypothetical protein SFW66_07910 [Gammaproteobacteria bacterium]|nr:hypothetical protein [Gammaproteobacteria bacterium]